MQLSAQACIDFKTKGFSFHKDKAEKFKCMLAIPPAIFVADAENLRILKECMGQKAETGTPTCLWASCSAPKRLAC